MMTGGGVGTALGSTLRGSANLDGFCLGLEKKEGKEVQICVCARVLGCFVQGWGLRWAKSRNSYHLAKKDGILTKSLWTRNSRICNAMKLPMTIRESPTFEYVVQPSFLGS